MHVLILNLLSLLIVSLLYPTFGGVTFMVYVDIVALFALRFAGLVPVLSIVGFGILGIVSARPINE